MNFIDISFLPTTLFVAQPDTTIHKMQAELDSGNWVLD